MTTSTKVRYSKDVEILGFRSVVEWARQSLGLSQGSSFLDIPPDSHLFGDYSLAVWTILDVFELPGTDQPFVMNAIAFGVDKALSTKSISQLHVLIPEVPEALLPEFQDVLEAESRIILEDGQLPRLVDPWVEVWEPGRIFKGLSALRYVLESQPLILLDVTDASGEDIRKAISLITQLRSESNLGRLVQQEFQPTILMPSLPSAFTYRLAVRLMEFLEARTSIKEWPEVTEDGIPSGVWNPWDMLTDESVPALASKNAAWSPTF